MERCGNWHSDSCQVGITANNGECGEFYSNFAGSGVEKFATRQEHPRAAGLDADWVAIRLEFLRGDGVQICSTERQEEHEKAYRALISTLVMQGVWLID